MMYLRGKNSKWLSELAKLLKFCRGTHPELVNQSTEEFRSQVTLRKEGFFIATLKSAKA